MTAGITLDIAEKRYVGEDSRGAVTALKGLQARIPPNEFCAVFGPSGCGKSTLLNMIAGIDRSFSGSVRFDWPRPPRIGYVFQTPRLLPWRTVRENIELVLSRPVSPSAVDKLIWEVGLAEVAGSYPGRLSGGMARRVALARAFAVEPDLLLLDEPFVSLDAAAADRLRALLLGLIATRPATVLFVTHDAAEAVTLADRILLLSPSPGRVLAEMPIRIPREQRRDRSTITTLLAELGRLGH
jgi:ABC-type nitrate/sulfonate/bicarbonate transport system ATPase subunit